MENNAICICGHRESEHGADPDANPICEDELIESGKFYACQADGCLCEEFEEEKRAKEKEEK